MGRSLAVVASMLGSAAVWAATDGDGGNSGSENVTTLDLIHVVAPTPLDDTGIDAAKLPYAVQSLDDAALARGQAPTLADFMARNLGGISINAAQDNPLQPDVTFRGFTATPLLGGSEGISVYLDGMRVNEAFGDTVNWDLIPDAAIERMSLMSGSNPVFGLNTLGGAISIRTKSGFSDPGTRAEFEGGAFGRTEATAETAGNDGSWGWYLMGNRFEEDGWRDLSPSTARRLYGTLSWRGELASLDLHLGQGHSDLTGNGAAPIELLRQRREAIFTAPDETGNDMDLVNLQGGIDLAAATRLSFTLFHRHTGTRSYNGDTSDAEACDDDDGALCDEDGTPILDQHGLPIPATWDAVNNLGHTRQARDGATVQVAFDQPLGELANQLVAGIDAGNASVHFDSSVEASRLDEERATVPDTGIFIPADAVAIGIRSRNTGIYATDTLSPTPRLALTLSGRWNRTRISLRDRSGADPGLDGDHAFERFNPAAGLTYAPTPAFNLYGGYSESTRAPTPVELSCADPDAPCKLPNQFLADPALHPVIAKSWETGLRGTTEAGAADAGTRWHVGLFRTTNVDDILFQATGGSGSNQGFYANVGNTRRQGLEAGIAGSACLGRLLWHANWNWLDATFRDGFTENSANHPDADDDGLIAVQRGDRIPGLARQTLKLGADLALAGGLALGGDVVAVSGQYLRGDEANRLPQLPGYVVLDLRASYAFDPRLSVFARIDNVFDHRYATFGTLGEPGAVFAQFGDPRFISPAAPRAAWVGLRLAL
jgi:outer membrane receptor protein involved in Fe transport